MSFIRSRRSFIRAALLAPVAYVMGVSRSAFAVLKKTVSATAEQAKTGLVDVKRADTPGAKVGDTMAKALKYVHKSDKKDQKCSGCLQYSQLVDGGKDVSITVEGAGKQKVGACALFDGGKGYVCADGWCMSWFKAQ